MDDIRAVMDVVGSAEAAIYGVSEGGSLAALFAARYSSSPRALSAWASLISWRRGSENGGATRGYFTCLVLGRVADLARRGQNGSAATSEGSGSQGSSVPFVPTRV
jgi:pimeloyl-ACP methyl ester carboxylesterase